MVEICSLASGSNGNCYYIGNQDHAVIVDCGISFKRMKERAEKAGLDITKVMAVFVSHEHGDHVKGVRVACKKLNMPAYFTSGTYNRTYGKDRPNGYREIVPNEPVDVFGIIVHPFRKHHDAADPVSFRVEVDGISIGVMTDIGVADVEMCKEFSKCRAVFLESNYDEVMLKNGPYPPELQDRVASDIGHLSNTQSFCLVRDFANEGLSHIVFSHISEHNNTPEKVLEKFSPFKDKYTLQIAPRYDVGEVIRL